VKTALLRGREHTRIGAVGAVAQGRAAVALSRGGAGKPYAHQEPNEDAALFAYGRHGGLAAVADGHFGATGAELALQYVLERAAPGWLGPDGPPADDGAWRAEALAKFAEIDAAIVARGRDAGLMAAPTTLCVAVTRPAAGRFWHASIGDSHLFEVHGEAAVARDVSAGAVIPGRPAFLGDGFASLDVLSASAETGSAPLAGLRALVLATDGLSEQGIGVEDPADLVVQLAAHEVAEDVRALELARGVVEAALAAHRRRRAGDNVAAAVLWLEAEEAGLGAREG